jgi:hypothetical protein
MTRWTRDVLWTATVVAACVGSVLWQTRHGEHPEWLTAENGGGTVAFATPSVVLPMLTSHDTLRRAVSALGILAWGLLAVAGDLSCTDCAFALMIPLMAAIPQLGAVGLSLALMKRQRERQA